MVSTQFILFAIFLRCTTTFTNLPTPKSPPGRGLGRRTMFCSECCKYPFAIVGYIIWFLHCLGFHLRSVAPIPPTSHAL